MTEEEVSQEWAGIERRTITAMVLANARLEFICKQAVRKLELQELQETIKETGKAKPFWIYIYCSRYCRVLQPGQASPRIIKSDCRMEIVKLLN